MWGTLVRAKGRAAEDRRSYVKGAGGAGTAEAPERLDDFDVVFLRNNPNVGGPEGDGFNPAIEFGRRLKQCGVMVFNDPDGLVRAGSKMYLAGFPGGDPPAHPDHPLGRARAGVPARAGRPGHHQAAARLRRPERVLRGAAANG